MCGHTVYMTWLWKRLGNGINLGGVRKGQNEYDPMHFMYVQNSQRINICSIF